MIGNDEVLVEHEFLAEAVARGAGSLGSVEREEPGLDFRDREARYGAGELLGEDDSARWSVVELHTATGALRIRLRIGGVEGGETVRELQSGLEAVGEPGLDAFAHDDAIDDHLDVVLVLLVERRCFLDGMKLSIDPHSSEAGLLPLGEFLAIFAFASPYDWSEKEMAARLGEGHHPVDHLTDLLGLDRKTRHRGIRDPDARPQEAHVVIDLGDGGDG